MNVALYILGAAVWFLVGYLMCYVAIHSERRTR